MTDVGRIIGAIPLMFAELGRGTSPPLGLVLVGGVVAEPSADRLHNTSRVPILRPARSEGSTRRNRRSHFRV